MEASEVVVDALTPRAGVMRNPVSKRGIRSLIQELLADSSNGRQRDVADQVATMRELVEYGAIQSLDRLLPCLLRLDGKPYSLDDYRPFVPLYRALMPKNTVYKTGRQVAKSTNLAAHGVLLANAIPNHKTLYVTPLYEQIRRFSNNYVRPFVNQSPIKPLLVATGTEQSVLQRAFRNNSRMLFSFALLDSDRIRGVSTHKVAIDEVQDMDPAHLPIIAETQTAARHLASSQFTGTSKSNENLLEGLWKRSSQAEWFIPCFSCNTWNIPAKEFHLRAMIGPVTPHISERYPGTVCHNCRNPISPRFGRWVHRYPEKRWLFAGYHIPQVILPLHYASIEKWSDLVRKMQGWGNTTEAVFWNEVMGEAVDAGQKLISETELKAASVLDWENNPNAPDPRIKPTLKHYKHRLLAIDWGGGGEEEVSFTAISVIGVRSNGKIDVLWGKRLLLGCNHVEEAKECIKWFRAFDCDFIAHDYTGAGEVRETVLIQAGFNPKQIFGVRLCRAAFQDIMVYHGPSNFNHHAFYSLDKARSLNYTTTAIRMGQIRFFKYDWRAQDNPGLTADFLALVENKVGTRLAGDVYTIVRNPLLTDDFAQSVNIGICMLWQLTQSWPNFAALAGIKRISRITDRQAETAGHRDYGWEQDPLQERYFGGP